MRRAVEFASTVDRLLSDVEHNMMMDDGDNPTRAIGKLGSIRGNEAGESTKDTATDGDSYWSRDILDRLRYKSSYRRRGSY